MNLYYARESRNLSDSFLRPEHVLSRGCKGPQGPVPEQGCVKGDRAAYTGEGFMVKWQEIRWVFCTRSLEFVKVWAREKNIRHQKLQYLHVDSSKTEVSG